jgi:hypothetical protein
MEKMGVPSVAMVTEAYVTIAHETAAKDGMPTLRIAFTPHPVWGKTIPQLHALVDGPDPVTGKPLMPEIVGYLTTPLTAEDEKSGIFPVSAGPSHIGPYTAEEMQASFMNNGMTDFLPIIIPTEKAVDAMLKGTSHHPDEIVGHVGRGLKNSYKYTVRQVAVNAVMAGCDPSYFPIVLAIASSGMLGLGGSTTSFGYSMVINGPIRDKLDMNYGIGGLSPFAQPNATIGRVWTLMGKNLGEGAVPGQTYYGSQGNQLNYNNAVVVEDEKNSPWTPFHVQKGFKREQNVVSLFDGWDLRFGHGAKGSGALMPKFDEQISSMFPTLTRMFNAMVIIDPLTAKSLKQQGYDTKEKLTEWLWKNTTVSAKDYRESFLAYVWIYPRALRGEEPYATWWKLPDDARVPCWPKPDDINLVVMGGQTNTFFQVGNMNYIRSISIDDWM